MANYRLPFDFDTGWQVSNGKWDDPVARHGDSPLPKESQAYASDFVHTNGAEGRNIRAVKDGTVLLVRNDLTENTWDWTDEQVTQYLASHPGLTPQALGCGSHVLVKHQDNSVAAYLHLKANQSFVTHKGQLIQQGGHRRPRGQNRTRFNLPPAFRSSSLLEFVRRHRPNTPNQVRGQKSRMLAPAR